MRSKWMTGLLIAAMSALLGGCLSPPNAEAPSAPPAGDGGGKERQLIVLTNRVDLIDNGVFGQYARRFEELHPGVTVQFEGLVNYTSDIMLRLSTRTQGDVLLLPNNLKNEDLSRYFEPLQEDIFYDARFADFKAHDGLRYGIAAGASTTGIVYNKKAFAAAGIREAPTTLDQFFEACRLLKEAGIVPVYLNYGAQWPLMIWGEDLVSYMSGDPEYLNKMAFSDEPWSLDNAWGEAIMIVRTLIEQGYVEESLMANQWEISKTELAAGRAGMYLMGNWVINQVIAAGADSQDIGFFPFPYNNESSHHAPLSPDWFVGISRFSSEKELAAEWVKFFVHDSGYVDDSGFLPVEGSRQSSLPQLEQFLSFQPIFLEKRVPSDKLLEIAASAQISLWSGEYIQEWLAEPELDKVFDEYNRRWKEARHLSES